MSFSIIQLDDCSRELYAIRATAYAFPCRAPCRMPRLAQDSPAAASACLACRLHRWRTPVDHTCSRRTRAPPTRASRYCRTDPVRQCIADRAHQYPPQPTHDLAPPTPTNKRLPRKDQLVVAQPLRPTARAQPLMHMQRVQSLTRSPHWLRTLATRCTHCPGARPRVQESWAARLRRKAWDTPIPRRTRVQESEAPRRATGPSLGVLV